MILRHYSSHASLVSDDEGAYVQSWVWVPADEVSADDLALAEGMENFDSLPNVMHPLFDLTNLLVRPTSPYTPEQERIWQNIVGDQPATETHILAFEAATGKKHDANHLY